MGAAPIIVRLIKVTVKLDGFCKRFVCIDESGFSSDWTPSGGGDTITYDRIVRCAPIGLVRTWMVCASAYPGGGDEYCSEPVTIYLP